MPSVSASPTAFTTRRTTAAPSASASRTIPQPSPPTPSPPGGNAKDRVAGAVFHSCWSWVWKTELQAQVCNAFGFTVTIAHYPTGASKWNPIEHRLFSEISKNWAAEPLTSYETMLNFIRTTSTQTGLVVTAYLDRKEY